MRDTFWGGGGGGGGEKTGGIDCNSYLYAPAHPDFLYTYFHTFRGRGRG